MTYNPIKIERKWQRVWQGQDFWKAKDFSRKPKFYVLVEFPYPSGQGLHVGHCRSYTAMDVLSRKRRMGGYNVLFPMGWDAFGLPTENYAIKTGIHPKIATKKNTKNFKRQEKSLGFSFDWTREINTTDPAYYKWTQWIFVELFKRGLTYKTKMPINWCPSCKIGLANEEVVEGKCERCGAAVTRRERKQWLLKITEYADRLIEDLAKVDYPERVKVLQREWIGKSEGDEITFNVKCQMSNVPPSPRLWRAGKANPESKCQNFKIKIFTTRLDTIFGATYVVIAPEHPIIRELKSEILNLQSVEAYIEKTKQKAERERVAEAKEKTGIELKGIKAINPATGKEIPIFAADYVLPHYGRGAVMAVPCHDQRDFEFAQSHNLPMAEVIRAEHTSKDIGFALSDGRYQSAYAGEGTLKNSGRFDGLNSVRARERMFEWLKRQGLAEKAVYYKLKDWIFSRQRYWGEPIPLVFCPSCKKQAGNPNAQVPLKESKLPTGQAITNQIPNPNFQKSKNKFNQGELLNPGWLAVPEKDLPVKLPNVKNYKPTDEGESPLAEVKKWLKVKCPKCGGPAQRETDVMPNWAGSNWYFLRYCDPKNDKCLADPKKLKYWLAPVLRSPQNVGGPVLQSPQGAGGVDWYNGGMEHSTLHLLYSRFIYKFLWDIEAVPKELGSEPYRKRSSHGMILGEGGIKMSKSKGNVINPDDIVAAYGADTMRVYEMFMGPFEQAIAWAPKGVMGARRFLERVHKLFQETEIRNSKSEIRNKSQIPNSKLKKLLHQTIKKVSEDIESMKFNTAISTLMEFSNEWRKEPQGLNKQGVADFLKLLAPFAPHLAEELFQKSKCQNPNAKFHPTPFGKRQKVWGKNPKSKIQNGKSFKFKSIFEERWPEYEPKLIEEAKITLIVQINGKVRDKIEIEKGISENETKEIVLKSPKTKKWLEGKQIKKTIFLQDKLINFVV